jgi:tricorn protease
VPLAGGRETLVLPNAALDATWDPEGRRLLYTGRHAHRPLVEGVPGQAPGLAAGRRNTVEVEGAGPIGGEGEAPPIGRPHRRLRVGAGLGPDGRSVLFASARLGDATRTFAPPLRSELANQVYA